MINRSCPELPASHESSMEDRYGAADADRTERRHQGAENSPWKKRAPRSFTARQASESTSIPSVSPKTGSLAENRQSRRNGRLRQEYGRLDQFLEALLAAYW